VGNRSPPRCALTPGHDVFSLNLICLFVWRRELAGDALCEGLIGGLGWLPTQAGNPSYLAGSLGDTEAQDPVRAASLPTPAIVEVETPSVSDGVAAPRARAASEPEPEPVPAESSQHNSPGEGPEDFSGLWLLCDTTIQSIEEESERARAGATLGNQQQPESPPLRRSTRCIKRRVL